MTVVADTKEIPVLKIVLTVIVICGCFPHLASAQSAQQKISWKSEIGSQPNRRQVRSEFTAEMFRINGTVAAFLANPLTATKLSTAAIIFELGTFFAGFPLVKERGSPANILVLSDTGQWAFVRKSALTPVVSISPLFETGKEKINSARRIFPLKNNGSYRNYTSACAGSNTQTRTKGSTLEANADLGILTLTFGGSMEIEETIAFDPGIEVIFRAFGIEGTDNFIEIINYQACGRSADRGQHTYDVRINGDQLYSLDPAKISGDDSFPMDRASNRAKITCRAHRDAYHNYLADELGVPDEWLQTVSSMTARWAKGFVAFEQC